MRPKKHLGQNFLINKGKIKGIIDALELQNKDEVLEIGPGRGALTEFLVASGKKIIAIEKDPELVGCLKEKFAGAENFQIIEGDALEILPKILESQKLKIKNYKVIGNIPYYITGYLFRILGELHNKPSLVVVTVQKEVALRICATPPRMNLLAASVQIWANPKIITRIPKRDFRPQPKIDSAAIVLRVTDEIKNDAGYYKLIKILFKQPRQTIANNLSRGLKEKKEVLLKKIRSAGIAPNDRPQNLSIEKIKTLSEKI